LNKEKHLGHEAQEISGNQTYYLALLPEGEKNIIKKITTKTVQKGRLCIGTETMASE
jgi:hypothetical protein